MFIVAINDVNCDESGAIVASSCDMCPYEMFIDHYGNDFAHYYDHAYDYIFNDGTFCKGDCSWNSDLEECQMKGTLQSKSAQPFSPLPSPPFLPNFGSNWFKDHYRCLQRIVRQGKNGGEILSWGKWLGGVQWEEISKEILAGRFQPSVIRI